jgi:hypothetical protein
MMMRFKQRGPGMAEKLVHHDLRGAAVTNVQRWDHNIRVLTDKQGLVPCAAVTGKSTHAPMS